MGNHVAGRIMALHVERTLAARTPDQSALDVLDLAVSHAKAEDGFGSDVEFESTDPEHPGQVHPDYSDERDPHPSAKLGMLLLEAFAPNGVADAERYRPMLEGTPPDGDESAEEAAYDAWYEEVGRPFDDRYGFR